MTENSVELDGDVFEEPLPFGEIEIQNVSKIRNFKICSLNDLYTNFDFRDRHCRALPNIALFCEIPRVLPI